MRFPPLPATYLRGTPMTEERKYAILFAATLLCARKLMELVRDHTKAVVLQLKNVVGMVEGLPHQAESHGANAW